MGVKSEDVLFVFNIYVPAQEALGTQKAGGSVVQCFCLVGASCWKLYELTAFRKG